MNKNIEINFTFDNSHGTNVFGRMTMPFIDGVAHKPINISVLSGTLDIVHIHNEGTGSKKLREKKDEIIREYCDIKGSLAYVKKPFFINNGKATGMVSLMGILNGFNSNRLGNLKFTSKHVNEYKAAQLFQNLKATTVVSNEYITMDQAMTEYDEYFKELFANYYQNKETSTTREIEVKNV